ncbi:hypothetical protein [Paenibacillus methanolicus]|uniref:Cyclic lactone autoinducer peptide n=1 Tax=Paenibacillus methanolicus TaxID=582686 RepID=A0A5S5BX36_9BACL|nr:hypothetical protein [Paenibacillus methanolicus]TYP71731.1 cyclic lactone autoinducer peptide [Paenibacillus methanolicus]
MKQRLYKVVAAVAIGVTSLFSLTGSYLWINQPRIPDELAKKEVV